MSGQNRVHTVMYEQVYTAGVLQKLEMRLQEDLGLKTLRMGEIFVD